MQKIQSGEKSLPDNASFFITGRILRYTTTKTYFGRHIRTGWWLRRFVQSLNGCFCMGKYKFNFVLTNKAVILVRDIERADSVNKVLEYVPISERNSTLYKPKSKAVPDSSNSMTNLEFKELSYCEKKKECKESRPVDPLERNKTILPTEAEYLKEINYRPFPARKIDVVWDKKSCSPIECENNDTKGEYHGRVQAKVFPNYNPTLFNGDSKDNHWLFDLGADSASRPVGVTGARGN